MAERARAGLGGALIERDDAVLRTMNAIKSAKASRPSALSISPIRSKR